MRSLKKGSTEVCKCLKKKYNRCYGGLNTTDNMKKSDNVDLYNENDI